VDVTDTDVARIPVGNIRVPRDEFAAVWAHAERRCHQQGDRGITDWYAAGVAVTCRWLAGAVAESYDGRRRLPPAPVSQRSSRAYEELIEAEHLAAERLEMRRPRLAWLASRPGWSEAVRTTLRWAWRHEGPQPFETAMRSTG
jgi:hypothetical protein